MDDQAGTEEERCSEIDDDSADNNSGLLWRTAGVILPPLSSDNGKKKLKRRRSIIIISCLYLSHSFSAWGDRMWAFAVSLLLALLYPGSLLLPGIHGFLVQLFVAIFGSIVGDWVDHNSRIKVATLSLIIQNGLLSFSSIAMALMFFFQWNVCLNVVMFGILTAAVIVLASGANLATVANTISIEKDWIVVIADGNRDALAVLNANMRRIDLCCKLLAPSLTGVILHYASPFITTVIVTIWNIVSFFGELGLLVIVYKMVPSLAIKKVRTPIQLNIDDTKVIESEDCKETDLDTESEALIDQTDESFNGGGDEEVEQMEKVIVDDKACWKRCAKLFSFLLTFKNGWKIFIRQEIVLVGFSMASIYLTVLGFSGVTSSYFLTQGLRSDLIGVFQGVGALFGVSGTLVYPFLRKKFGTIRTGLFGITTQLFILLFCFASVFLPSRTATDESNGYYSPDCSSFLNDSGSTIEMSSTVLLSSSDDLLAPSVTKMCSSSAAFFFHNSSTIPHISINSSVSIAVILMLIGVVGCRLGLWLFDLAVQQLVQEKVIEEERGVVSGIMNAMNSIMDMLHYILVIAAPRPEHFNILTIISFIMVALGWLLYCLYVRKSRGHFFHFRDCTNYIKNRRTRVILSQIEEN